MNTSISFIYKNTNYIIPTESLYKSWIEKAFDLFRQYLLELTITFVDKKTMRQYNRQYLEHDYDTDILTFDYSRSLEVFSDIIISIDTAKENAKEHNISLEVEILRLIAHGVLHIVGYKDETPMQKEKMTIMENKIIKMFHVEQNKIK